MSYARANLSIALSLSGGKNWDYRLQVTDEFQYTDYSSLVNGELIRGNRNQTSENPIGCFMWSLENN